MIDWSIKHPRDSIFPRLYHYRKAYILEIDGLQHRRLFVNRKKLYIVVNSVSIDSLITNAARSIDVPLVKPNCNDDCCDGSWCSIRLSIRDRPFNLKGGLWFFVSFKIVYSNNTRVSIFIFLVAQSANCFPEFHIRLYDKNSESYFFCLHQNQNIFFSNIGNQNSYNPTVR